MINKNNPPPKQTNKQLASSDKASRLVPQCSMTPNM